MDKKLRKKRRLLSEKDKEDISLLYDKGESCQSISEKFNSDPSWIVKIAKDMGVWKKKSERYKDVGRTMNDGQIAEMKQMHESKMHYPEISVKLGRSLASVKNTALKEGLIGHRRKYEINEEWLNEIDSPEKAIFLGLFFADGCNVKNDSRCEIFLQEGDRDYLDGLRKFFTDKPLTKRKSSKYNTNTFDQYGIQIFSDIWTKNLSKYGAVPNKTFLLNEVRFVPKKYEKYFIRGLFEGDGCLHKSKQGYFRFSLVGPKSFMVFCQDIILRQTGVQSNIYKDKNHKNDTFSLVVGKQSSAKKIIKWIYSDYLELAMTRKYNKAKELMNSFFALFLESPT